MSYPYFFVSPEYVKDNNILITGDDAKHLIKVLRVKIKERIEVSDNQNFRYIAEAIEIRKNEVLLKIIQRKAISHYKGNFKIKVALFQCLLKKSAMEFVIQKNTELGIDEIIPVRSKRVVVNEKVKSSKLCRWNKIAIEASKQCKRDFILQVKDEILVEDIKPQNYDLFYIPYEVIKYEDLISVLGVDNKDVNDINFLKFKKNNVFKDINFIFKEKKKLINDKGKNKEEINIGFIVGPEGGFEVEEVNLLSSLGAIPISLGENILRADTASIFLSSIIKYSIFLTSIRHVTN